MKILGTGDLHWRERGRLKECRRVHDFIGALVESEKPDLFVCGGDVYDGPSTPYERQLVASFFRDVARTCPVLIARGNHDRLLDCALLARLRSDHPIVVEEAAGVHYIAGAAIAVVAWPERCSILNVARALELDPGEVEDLALQNILRGLGLVLEQHDGPRLALGHIMVTGAEASTGQPLIGQPMELGLADLGLLRASIVLMSHIHKPQAWGYGGSDIVYMGSPYRENYGETEDKSVVLVEFEGRDLVRWSRIPTPCAGMFLIDDEWHPTEHWLAGAHGLPDVGEMQGAEIRFRYTVDPDQRVQAAEAAAQSKQQWLALGAADVKVEECVRTSTRARAPEVAKASSIADKLRAYWKARGTTPDPARAERLVARARDLETTE